MQEIFAAFLNGTNIAKIAEAMQVRGVPKLRGECKWSKHGIRYILTNERYMGDQRFRKSFRTDKLPYKKVDNRGQMPQFYLADSHPAIIEQEIFQKAQTLLAQHGQQFGHDPVKHDSPWAGMATRPTPDNELVQLVTNKLAAVADLPEPPKPPEPRCRITRQELCLQREFDRALNVSQPDVRYLIAQSQKIAAEAYQRSQCSHVWLTAQIQNRLLAWPPGTPLEQDVFEAVVSKILLAAEASVQIQLTNQQVL